MEANMAVITASWAHGNAVVVEAPDDIGVDIFSFVHYGWGTQICVRPGNSRWFHIPIPTPVLLGGKRVKLIRVFLQWEQKSGYAHCGHIEDAHLWDGQTRVATKSANDFKQDSYAMLPGHDTYELLAPKECYFGLGLSFKLGAHGSVKSHFVDDREAPVMVIGSAGADFEL